MSDDTEKLLVFNRLQRLLKELQTSRASVAVYRIADYGHSYIFREKADAFTDELNGILSKIRDWEGGRA